MSHEVRQARPAELAAVLELATAFYLEEGFATPTAELRHNLRVLLQSERARVAVAVDHDHIVGFAVSTVSFGLEQGCVTELEDLFVRPGHRRTGIGAALINDSAAWAISCGCRSLELVVAPNGRDVEHLFGYYGRRGFTDQGRRLLSRDLHPAVEPSADPAGQRVLEKDRDACDRRPW